MIPKRTTTGETKHQQQYNFTKNTIQFSNNIKRKTDISTEFRTTTVKSKQLYEQATKFRETTISKDKQSN